MTLDKNRLCYGRLYGNWLDYLLFLFLFLLLFQYLSGSRLYLRLLDFLFNLWFLCLGLFDLLFNQNFHFFLLILLLYLLQCNLGDFLGLFLLHEVLQNVLNLGFVQSLLLLLLGLLLTLPIPSVSKPCVHVVSESPEQEAGVQSRRIWHVGHYSMEHLLAYRVPEINPGDSLS